jgi:ABC-type multidrug transport system fused ATPase/permease subunit
MNVDTFLESVSASGLRLPSPGYDSLPGRAHETIDAIFHLPLLALAVMVIARQKPFKTVALGRSVAMLLVEHFSALRRSAHAFETSMTLRRRCADSLAFLEAAGLMAVSADSQRIVTLTRAGKTHLDHALRESNDLGLLTRQLRINQERVTARIGVDER